MSQASLLDPCRYDTANNYLPQKKETNSGNALGLIRGDLCLRNGNIMLTRISAGALENALKTRYLLYEKLYACDISPNDRQHLTSSVL